MQSHFVQNICQCFCGLPPLLQASCCLLQPDAGAEWTCQDGKRSCRTAELKRARFFNLQIRSKVALVFSAVTLSLSHTHTHTLARRSCYVSGVRPDPATVSAPLRPLGPSLGLASESVVPRCKTPLRDSMTRQNLHSDLGCQNTSNAEEALRFLMNFFAEDHSATSALVTL